MPIRFLPAGVTAVHCIGAFRRKGVTAGLADRILSLLQPLFALVLPKADIAASFVAIFLAVYRSIEDFAATSADDPPDRINEVTRSAVFQTGKVIIS